MKETYPAKSLPKKAETNQKGYIDALASFDKASIYTQFMDSAVRY